MISEEKKQEILSVLSDFNNEASDIITDESVDVYLFIRSRFKEKGNDIVDDKVFQFVYRSFYRLDNAGLGDKIKSRYFQLFNEAAKSKDGVNIKRVCDELGKINNLKNKKTMQFSFATKMAATINENMPIYDSLVAKVFGFSPPHAVKDWDKKYEQYSDFYSNISETVEWLKQQDNSHKLMKTYSEKISNWELLPEMKKYDFMFWATGKAIINQA